MTPEIAIFPFKFDFLFFEEEQEFFVLFLIDFQIILEFVVFLSMS